jgi:hypothetical protein
MSVTESAPIERWKQLADAYSAVNGRPVSADDIVRYPMQIVSLLSDVQHRANGDLGPGVNDMINAAKLMLSRMIDAARAAENADGSRGS